MWSRSSNCAWVIPAAWSPVNHATNPSNRVDDAANAASAVSDAYPGIRLLLRKCSGVGTDEPTGKEPPPNHDTPTNGRSHSNRAHLQKSRTHMDTRTPLKTLARLAKVRWRIEHDYRELKTGLGIDHFEGRSFVGWHRHVTLAVLAQAFCTLLRLDPKAPAPA